MICFRCDNETDFEVQEVEVEQLYRNKLIKVLTPVTTCKNCGWYCLDKGQLDSLLKNVKNYSNMHEWKTITLFNADPDCKHYIEVQWSGVKCIKCDGWYCS